MATRLSNVAVSVGRGRIDLRHLLTTAALCSCSFCNAFLVISVFPYAGYMALDLVKSASTDTAGIYAGAIASSFFAARFLTAYQWGRLSDAYGRTVTLKIALLLSAAFSILFGLSNIVDSCHCLESVSGHVKLYHFNNQNCCHGNRSRG